MNREKISKACSEWLDRAMKNAGLKAAELERVSGVSKQNISRILRQTPSKKGTPPRPEPETMILLAKALNQSETEALGVAGYTADDFNPSNLRARKAADIVEKLPSDKADEFIDYGEHLLRKHASKTGQKRVQGAKAARKTRKSANTNHK